MSQNLIAKWSAGLILATIPLTSMAQTPTASARLPTSNNPALKLNGNLGLAPLLSAQERVDFEAISVRYDRRIIAEIEKNPARKTAMETELRAIASEANDAKKEELIKAYQARHKASYRQALSDGRIDLGAMATELNSKISGLEFKVTDGINLTANYKSAPVDARKLQITSQVGTENKNPIGSLQATPSSSQDRTVKELVSADYERVKQLGCGAIAGSDVSFDGGFITNKTFAAVVGGCENRGDLEYSFEVMPQQQAKLEISVGQEDKVFAIGIGGMAHSTAYSTILMSKGRDGRAGTDAITPVRVCSVFAPIFWTASTTCGRENVSITSYFPGPGHPDGHRFYRFMVGTHTDVIATPPLSFASAEARVKRLRTKVTIEPLR